MFRAVSDMSTPYIHISKVFRVTILNGFSALHNDHWWLGYYVLLGFDAFVLPSE